MKRYFNISINKSKLLRWFCYESIYHCFNSFHLDSFAIKIIWTRVSIEIPAAIRIIFHINYLWCQNYDIISSCVLKIAAILNILITIVQTRSVFKKSFIVHTHFATVKRHMNSALFSGATSSGDIDHSHSIKTM